MFIIYKSYFIYHLQTFKNIHNNNSKRIIYPNKLKLEIFMFKDLYYIFL